MVTNATSPDGTPAGKNVSVQVSKGADESVKLGGLLFTFEKSDGNSFSKTKNGSTEMPENGGVKTFSFTDLDKNVVSVTLAPMIKVGNSIKQCDASTSKIQLPTCN
jgi:hypothetical protein